MMCTSLALHLSPNLIEVAIDHIDLKMCDKKSQYDKKNSDLENCVCSNGTKLGKCSGVDRDFENPRALPLISYFFDGIFWREMKISLPQNRCI